MKLKGAPTAADLAELAAIHRRLQALTTSFNPAAARHPPLMAAVFAARSCLAEWSGDPMACPGTNRAPAGGRSGPPWA